MLAGDLLPGWLSEIIAESDAAIVLGIREKNSPAVFGHAHVAECGPAFCVHRNGGAQVDIGSLKIRGPEILPPAHEFRLPVLEGALQNAIRAEFDVVRNAILIV